MADPISRPKTKWLWLVIIVMLGIVLLLWVFGGADREDTRLADAPVGLEEQAGADAPVDGEQVEVQLPDSDFELPPPETEAE